MLFKLLIAFCALFSAQSALSANYRTSCKIVNGEAVGSIHTDGSLSFSGKVYFYQYDDDFDLVDEDWELAIVIVVGASTEVVEETNADDDAVHCRLDISEAVGYDGTIPGPNPGPNPDLSYWTSCQIENGRAVGYVHTDGSLSFSGKVYFYQYDEDSRLVDEDWELAIVIVVGADIEKVEDTDADDDAVSCYLDISEAVEG